MAGAEITTILIIESNTPDLVMGGAAAALGFVKSFSALAPEVRLRVAAPYALALTEGDLADVDGVVFTGSSTPWGVDTPENAPIRAAMEMCFARGLPVWGSCNGMQLGAVVLGGTVGDCPNGTELGVAQDLQLTADGQDHPMLAGRADGFSVPCIHRHEVQSLGPDTVLLAGNTHTGIQSIACETGQVRFWGTQYHPELSLADIACFAEGGAFGDAATTLGLMQVADGDASAAEALGTDAAMLAARRTELANWLAYVRRVKAEAGSDQGEGRL